jgi:hypothetical protein
MLDYKKIEKNRFTFVTPFMPLEKTADKKNLSTIFFLESQLASIFCVASKRIFCVLFHKKFQTQINTTMLSVFKEGYQHCE